VLCSVFVCSVNSRSNQVCTVFVCSVNSRSNQVCSVCVCSVNSRSNQVGTVCRVARFFTVASLAFVLFKFFCVIYKFPIMFLTSLVCVCVCGCGCFLCFL